MDNKKQNKDKNYAFIDGQNLYMSTAKRKVEPWRIDLARFRIYLSQKYHVDRAYYHLGYVSKKQQDLYEKIQNAGFILVFKKHSLVMAGLKKGNVDSDIIFSVMRRLYKKEDFAKIIIVSGDGDYKSLVDFLIEENRFEKILFPDFNRASSLYKKITRKYFDGLDRNGVRGKIEKKRGP